MNSVYVVRKRITQFCMFIFFASEFQEHFFQLDSLFFHYKKLCSFDFASYFQLKMAPEMIHSIFQWTHSQKEREWIDLQVIQHSSKWETMHEVSFILRRFEELSLFFFKSTAMFWIPRGENSEASVIRVRSTLIHGYLIHFDCLEIFKLKSKIMVMKFGKMKMIEYKSHT